MSSFEYVGSELDAFAAASNWKVYIAALLQPHVRGAVLEVGAGIGATTRALWHPGVHAWLCLEPDAAMADRLRDLRLSGGSAPEVVHGTLASLQPGRRFDTVLYIDVLEHIQDDRAELSAATAHLAPGGSLFVLAPAFPSLYSEFDRAIGHCRRYTAASLTAAFPPALRRRAVFYADSAGVLLSAANRLLLRQSLPTPRQIQVWDRVVLPVSRILDPLLGRRVGRSVIAIYANE
jgi:SAM-dependent methyltransferase